MEAYGDHVKAKKPPKMKPQKEYNADSHIKMEEYY